ncbi:tetratricopeptide repeat protein [Arenibacter algicola]|uniref:tetratricopeptide repeat protein n=1 Tax=Arenibacter algicola TaxID=616991 RepID=UPI0006901476|nr:tetratricopeptide repeat protein [Arenibacter algicola]
MANLQNIFIFCRRHLLYLLLILSFIQYSCRDQSSKYIPVTEGIVHDVFTSTESIDDNNFVGNKNCKECHVKEFETWKGSDHDNSMQVANRKTILAKFEGERFKSQGITSRFFQKEKEFYVNTEGPDGEYHDYKIVYVFGIRPLQQYIVQFPKGRYQCLRTAWDTQKNKWFDLYPNFKIVHSEWLHWSRGGMNWNNMCSDCHSTNVRKNYNPNDRSYSTKFSEINVSCETCHGPGKRHINEVKSLGSTYDSLSGYMQMTAKTNAHKLVDECARCHMRREQISEGFNFEGTMMDHYFPQLIESPIYYPDGQISDEDYVYGSFIQSKMYQNNVSCKDCHDSHSLKLKFEGNKLCLQCHQPKYDHVDHHRHKSGGEGAKCINCHMPGKFYMGNDFRRDHSFRIPRPDLSIKYSTPNACTQCHTDKTEQWAWQAFKKNYGVPDYVHFSEKLVPGIIGDPDAANGLLELAHDQDLPEMARASAVKVLVNYQVQDDLNTFIALLSDQSPLVRGAALDVLGQINSMNYTEYLLPRLKDGKRANRVKAFYALASVGEFQIPNEYKTEYGKVEKEFMAYLRINGDFSGGQGRKAAYYERKGDLDLAMEAYVEALKIDKDNNMIRSNLANLYYRLGDTQNAEKAFREIIEQEPEFGGSYYSLALLLSELGRMNDAVIEMEHAHRLMPSNIRAIYNLGLLYQKVGKPKEAENILSSGLWVDAENEDILYALAFLYLQEKQKENALQTAKRIIALYPNKSEYQNLLRQANSL